MDFRKEITAELCQPIHRQILMPTRQIYKIQAKFQTQQWTVKAGQGGGGGGGGREEFKHWKVNFGWWKAAKPQRVSRAFRRGVGRNLSLGCR